MAARSTASVVLAIIFARLTSRRIGSRSSIFKSSLAAKDMEGCKTYMSILTSC